MVLELCCRWLLAAQSIHPSSMESLTVQHTPLKFQAFDRLQAEYERSWLDQVFIEPPDFAAMVGMRSILVFGAGGAGKTALYVALTRYAAPAGGAPARLVVDWRPSIAAELSGSQALRACLEQMFDACSL